MTGELFLTRAATVVSMQQLLDDEPCPRLPAVAPTPDQPVSAVAEGGLLPLVSFAALLGIQAKRVRSFGDLMVVPDNDVDDPRCASWPVGAKPSGWVPGKFIPPRPARAFGGWEIGV